MFRAPNNRISSTRNGHEDSGKALTQSIADMEIKAPEIQTMYSLSIPVPALRTKMRQEFERHRYVNQIGVVDMLLFQSHAEYQVCGDLP
jgi:NADH dehydrogenase (ubiquinone) 1 alpha subcomplex subunit 6